MNLLALLDRLLPAPEADPIWAVLIALGYAVVFTSGFLGLGWWLIGYAVEDLRWLRRVLFRRRPTNVRPFVPRPIAESESRRLHRLVKIGDRRAQ